MNKSPNVTPLNLHSISYVYDELSNQERGEFKLQKILNSWLYEEVEDFRRIKHEIDSSQLNPNISTLKNILAYSKKVY